MDRLSQRTRLAASFTDRLKRAVTGDATTPVVLMGNFEVEEVWARGETTLPRVSSAYGAAIVNRMDEFAIWLGTSSDTVLMKEMPDPDFLETVEAQGFELPSISAVTEQHSSSSITADVAGDSGLLDSGRALARSGSMLLPHSSSELESSLAHEMGMRLATPTARVCKLVNGKVYSRRLADLCDIRQPNGEATETVDDWLVAVAGARRKVQDGQPVVVKEAYGVSGKGLAVVTSEARLDRLAAIVTKRAHRNDGRAQFSVEDWIDKNVDLNYQFTLGLDGSINFDFVKIAATSRGVHLGHSYPAVLSPSHIGEIHEAAARIGSVLFADGYFGVVGVDAIIDAEGTLYPMLEINARFNMSTYQAKIDDLIDRSGGRGRAKHYDLRLQQKVTYGAIHDLLGSALYSRDAPEGLIINNFATVNAAMSAEKDDGALARLGSNVPAIVPGRLYGVVVAKTDEMLDALDAEIVSRLRTIEKSPL